MTSQSVTAEELLTSVHEAEKLLLDLMVTLDEQVVNRIPYADSWTAGQLFRHVAKSTRGIAGAMSLNVKPAERDPGARIAELKKRSSISETK